MASVQMQELTKIMKQMMEQRGMPMFGNTINPIVLRQTIETAASGMPVDPGVNITHLTLGEVEGERCDIENPRKDAVIFYVHGGGLICGNAFTSRGYASILVAETKIPVYTVSYRLAPEHPFPTAVDDVYTAYVNITERHPNTPIFLIGESGGAYLSIVTALQARDKKTTMPAGVIAYSTVMDMSGSLDRSANEGKDITLTNEGLLSLRKLYVPDENLWAHPYVSPILADYSGMPPMFLVWDEDETLAPDSEKLVDKLEVSGVSVQYKSYPGCFHAFATAGKGTPESAEVLADTIDFINRIC